MARCQYAVVGSDNDFDVQLVSQCGSDYACLSVSVPEIHHERSATAPIFSCFHICMVPSLYVPNVYIFKKENVSPYLHSFCVG